ncbi:site-specific integrase [Alicyclobacillus sp. TC]|uniref:tyrosine-type recombinase/integrase n=1 Tax=Alicyclobacillus sp. TC TaxID=2606450 RepID=UPI0019349665|nr:site-specific integrase [Alicyclobacillus sp. TC]QRF22257.1 site-specific integrase [Alicyclobacillus sp. TC]
MNSKVKKSRVGNKPGIRKRGDKYYARVFCGRDAGGKPVYEEKAFCTLSEAQEFRAKKLLEKRQGTYVKPSKEFLREFCRTFLQEKEYQVREGTLRKYSWLVNKYIIPELGHIELRKLRPHHLQDLYTRLAMPGDCEKCGLSLRSVKHIHVLIKHILKQACIKGKISVNPASAVNPPRPPQLEMQTWSESEVASFLEAARNSRYYIFFALALGTGMRLGEVLGLKWRDVDWVSGKIHVQRSYTHGLRGYVFQQPKTKKGNRTIKLAPSTLRDLYQHRSVQEAERQQAGDLWNDQDLIVTTCTGNAVLAHNVRSTFLRLLAKSSLPRIRIHDLRHTHATLLLKQGVNVKVVSERLGHESISVTLDIYSHVLESMQDEAAEKFDTILSVSVPTFEHPYGQDMGTSL